MESVFPTFRIAIFITDLKENQLLETIMKVVNQD